MPLWNTIYVQNSYSPVMEHLKFFHDHSMVVIIALSVMFLMLMSSYGFDSFFNHKYLESQAMEFFWTFAPSIMLMFLAIPSMKMLYLLEEQKMPKLNIKITGYQWFWGYEYKTKIFNKSFDSNLLMNNKKFKLLETSQNMIIPYSVPIRLLVTSKDVIHSWAMPSLGAKMDAIPGRLNQMTIISNRPGLSVGQCSEICGSGHSFMPIFMESVNYKNFIISSTI